MYYQLRKETLWKQHKRPLFFITYYEHADREIDDKNPTWSLDYWAYKGFHILLNQYVLSYHWTITKEPYRTNHHEDHRIQRRSRTTQKSIEYYFTSSRK